MMDSHSCKLEALRNENEDLRRDIARLNMKVSSQEDTIFELREGIFDKVIYHFGISLYEYSGGGMLRITRRKFKLKSSLELN